ncbi:MAG: CYTH and CHAD domain-containing protein [Pseudomonadota bacterium]
MREIELKISLDAAQERQLRASRDLMALSDGAERAHSLWSVYYDTEDHALRRDGIALRLRRQGRSWVQTLKIVDSEMINGLSQPEEIEYAVAGQTIDLTRIPDHDLREHVMGLARPGLKPVAETRFRRTRRVLKLPECGASVELAIDKGKVGSGARSEPFIEAEIELIEGAPAALYDVAKRIFPKGPVRFSVQSKSERALALTVPEIAPPSVRKARPVDLSQVQSVEQAAIAIFSEGIAHAAPNIAALLESNEISGPHQTRVALRRLRSAMSAFRTVLGRRALEDLARSAQVLAAQAGRIRDLDVLADQIVAHEAKAHPNEPGFDCLAHATRAQRDVVRLEVRSTLIDANLTAFPLDMAGFIAGRGWVDGADHGQTKRLAQPLRPYARKVLDKRWKSVSAWGARIDELSIDERHEMRKEVKKLRYLLDAFRSLFDPERVAKFNRHVKRLQKAFGALNDSAMAEALLLAPDAPGRDDPAAQRAAGRIIGRLLSESDRLWPGAIDDWRALSAFGPCWR